MKIKVRNIPLKINNAILSIYGICVFLYAILQSNISTQYPLCKNIILVCFTILMVLAVFMKIKCNGSVREKDAIILGGLFVLLVYNVLINGFENGTLFIIPFCYLLSGCKIDDILSKYSAATFCAVFFVILLSKIGIIDNHIFTNYATIIKVRHGLGFIWTTFGPNMFLSAVLAFVAYKREKISFVELLILFFVNIYFYMQTKTLAVFICVILCLFFIFMSKFTKICYLFFKRKIIEIIFSHFAFITAIFTILFQIYYNMNVSDSVILNTLNRVTSFRLGLGQEAFSRYKITLFGQMITWSQGTAKNYFYLDSSYLSVLFNNGVIMLGFVCFLMNIVCTYGIKRQNYFLVIAVSIFLIHCITDPQLIDFRNNPFFMIVLQCFIYLRQGKNSVENRKGQRGKMCNESDDYIF